MGYGMVSVFGQTKYDILGHPPFDPNLTVQLPTPDDFNPGLVIMGWQYAFYIQAALLMPSFIGIILTPNQYIDI